LESEPKPPTGNGQILVVFRGAELDPRQQLIADVDPAALAAAIEHVKAERETAQEQQIRDHAHKYGIDPEEMSLAWELWQHQEARAAGLRVLVLSDSNSTTTVQTSPPVIISTPIHIPTDQGEQSVALESEVPRFSTDSNASA
jgi:hypothetical protein